MNTAATVNQTNTYSQPNQGYNNYQQMNSQQKMNMSESFKWNAGAIIWFVILIIISLYTIFLHLQLHTLLNIDVLYLEINEFYSMYQAIILSIATLQILSIIVLLVKKLRFCVYSFFILEFCAILYNLYLIYNLSQLYPYAGYILPSFIFIIFVKILIYATVTYLVLRNRWQDLK